MSGWATRPRSRRGWFARGAFGLGLSLLVLAGTSSAEAQAVVLLPLPSDTNADESAALAHTAVSEALGMQGLQVIPWEAAKGRLPEDERAQCSSVSACVPLLLRFASVELAAGVAVTYGPKRVAQGVRVALIDRAEDRYDGEAKVAKGDVRHAATRAVLEARSYHLLGPGPWLHVDGTPEGAEVLLDERVVGRVPYRASVQAGSHNLRVRDAGYVAFERTLEIPRSRTHREDVLIALEPAPIALHEAHGDELRPLTAGTQRGAEEGGSAWMVWPSLVGGAGLVIAGLTSVRLITGLDDCVRPDLGLRCTQRSTIEWGPTVLAYSVSAALIGTAVVWFVAGSNDGVERAAAAPRMQARVGLGSLTLTGSF